MNTENTTQQTPDPVPSTESILRERPGALPKFPKRNLRILSMAGAGLLALTGGFLGGMLVSPDKTPEACVSALESAETVIGLQTEGLLISADAFDSASRFSIAGMDRSIDQLNGVADSMAAETPTYKMYVDRCMETK